jgi:hypothetical protein
VPPEDCGGPATFVELEASLNLALWEKKQRLIEIMTQILPDIMDGKGRSTVEPHRNELGKLLEHLKEAEFDPSWLPGSSAWFAAIFSHIRRLVDRYDASLPGLVKLRFLPSARVKFVFLSVYPDQFPDAAENYCRTPYTLSTL